MSFRLGVACLITAIIRVQKALICCFRASRGWAEPHPIARQMGLEGMVLVYTPRTFGELEVLWSRVLDAYCYVTERPRPEPDPVS